MTIDDRSSGDIGKQLDQIIEVKNRASAPAMLLLAVLAGMYIGFGALSAATILSLAPTSSQVIVRFLAASVFCVGLIMVVIPGSELFTGNILMAAGTIRGRVRFGRLLWSWSLAWLGNFLGALALAVAVRGSGLMGTTEAMSELGQTMASVAEAKIALTLTQGFIRGILCNILVCLAVLLALSARTVQGKVLGIYFPIMTFVLCGFEHSIANMFFLPAGLLAKGELVTGFLIMFKNLIPVTLGNIAGGLLVLLLHPNRWRQMLRSGKRSRSAASSNGT